jgi:hypothetical protein
MNYTMMIIYLAYLRVYICVMNVNFSRDQSELSENRVKRNNYYYYGTRLLHIYYLTYFIVNLKFVSF